MVLKRPLALILLIVVGVMAGPDVRADFAEGAAAYEAGNFAAAYDAWQPIAEAGDPDAQLALGILYENGRGVARDYKAAIAWYTRSAEAGHSGAQFNLGNMYRQGNGVAQNLPRAVLWWTLAADKGLPGAMLNLGIAYHLGEGVAKDPVRAFELFRRAAEAGIPTGQFSAGYAYELGLGTEPDLHEARRLYALAAEAGVQQAAERLAALDWIEVVPLANVTPPAEDRNDTEITVAEDVAVAGAPEDVGADGAVEVALTEPQTAVIDEPVEDDVAVAAPVEVAPVSEPVDAPSAASGIDVAGTDPADDIEAVTVTDNGDWPFIQLAAFLTESRAKVAWEDLAERYPDLLGDLPHRVHKMVLSGDPGTMYGLQVGPLPASDEAEAVCRALRSRNADCFLVSQ